MATKNTILGTVPKSRGRYTEGDTTTKWYYDNILEYKGSSFRCISEASTGITGAPATYNANTHTLVPNAGWEFFVDTTGALNVKERLTENEKKLSELEGQINGKREVKETFFLGRYLPTVVSPAASYARTEKIDWVGNLTFSVPIGYKCTGVYWKSETQGEQIAYFVDKTGEVEFNIVKPFVLTCRKLDETDISIEELQELSSSFIIKSKTSNSLIDEVNKNSEDIQAIDSTIESLIGITKTKGFSAIVADSNYEIGDFSLKAGDKIKISFNGSAIWTRAYLFYNNNLSKRIGDLVYLNNNSYIYELTEDISMLSLRIVSLNSGGNVSVTITTEGKIDGLESRVKDLEDGIDGSIDICVPSKIYVPTNDRLQIFWRSVFGLSNPYMYDIGASCSYGKNLPRFFQYDGDVANSGKTATLNLYVKNDKGNTIASKSSVLNFISAPTTPSVNKNILCIGASATVSGVWVEELRRRLCDTSGTLKDYSNPLGLGLSNITFVGRKLGSEKNVHLEATGGWKVQDYASSGEFAIRFFVPSALELHYGDQYSLNDNIFIIQENNSANGNIRCTLNTRFYEIPNSGTLTLISGTGARSIQYTSYSEETFSPFWDDSQSDLDFVSYANSYCNGSIDVMIWHCGVNDIFTMTESSIDDTISAFRRLLDKFHQQFPSSKVIISSVPLGDFKGGFAERYGASATYTANNFARQARTYAQRLEELTISSTYSSFVVYAPVLETFDSEYSYPAIEKNVNNRVALKESIGEDAVHPTEQGSMMVADGIFRVMKLVIN